jgi:hypothetical protein
MVPYRHFNRLGTILSPYLQIRFMAFHWKSRTVTSILALCGRVMKIWKNVPEIRSLHLLQDKIIIWKMHEAFEILQYSKLHSRRNQEETKYDRANRCCFRTLRLPISSMKIIIWSKTLRSNTGSGFFTTGCRGRYSNLRERDSNRNVKIFIIKTLRQTVLER